MTYVRPNIHTNKKVHVHNFQLCYPGSVSHFASLPTTFFIVFFCQINKLHLQLDSSNSLLLHKMEVVWKQLVDVLLFLLEYMEAIEVRLCVCLRAQVCDISVDTVYGWK